MFYEGTEPISDYTLDKTIKFGVPNHPNLKNVLIFNTSITLPAGITPNDFQFVGYPDHIRFRVDTGSRTLTYKPASPSVETDVTGQQNGTSQGAVIAVSAEDRYAIALYSRQTDVGQYLCTGSTRSIRISHSARRWHNPGTLIAGTTFTLHSYVIVGTLHDVEASLVELYSVNPPP